MICQTERFHVRTYGKGTYDVTKQLLACIRTAELREGTATVFVRHTSASLVIMENADPTARADLHEFFERLVPENTPWFAHNMEGPDDMPSHIRMALTRTSEVVPVENGQVLLGTWQGLYLFEHRAMPHTREITVTLVGVA